MHCAARQTCKISCFPTLFVTSVSVAVNAQGDAMPYLMCLGPLTLAIKDSAGFSSCAVSTEAFFRAAWLTCKGPLEISASPSLRSSLYAQLPVQIRRVPRPRSSL